MHCVLVTPNVNQNPCHQTKNLINPSLSKLLWEILDQTIGAEDLAEIGVDLEIVASADEAAEKPEDLEIKILEVLKEEGLKCMKEVLKEEGLKCMKLLVINAESNARFLSNHQ